MKPNVTLSSALPKITIELTPDKEVCNSNIELHPGLPNPTIKLDAISKDRELELSRFFVGPKGKDADISKLAVVNPVLKIINNTVQLPVIPRGELIHNLGIVFTDLIDNEVENNKIKVDRDLVVVELINLYHKEGLITVPEQFEGNYLQVSYVVWE